MNKIRPKPLIVALAISLAVGGLAAFLIRDDVALFSSLNQPPLSPPSWLFPVVWTILYLLMGLASYLVYTSSAPQEQIRAALLPYGVSLVLNFLWPVLFFRFQLYGLALVDLLALWVLILVTLRRYLPVSRTAANLLYPYLLWTTFAGYLNLGFLLLN